MFETEKSVSAEQLNGGDNVHHKNIEHTPGTTVSAYFARARTNFMKWTGGGGNVNDVVSCFIRVKRCKSVAELHKILRP